MKHVTSWIPGTQKASYINLFYAKQEATLEKQNENLIVFLEVAGFFIQV